MDEERAFLAELREHPEDDVTRLVYADWLEERDDPRGAYLRAEVALGRMGESDEGYADAEAELVRLREGIDDYWLGQAGTRWDVVLATYPLSCKIATIKTVREIGGYGLADARAIVEEVPSVLLKAAPRHDTEKARRQFARSKTLAEVRVRIVPYENDPPGTIHGTGAFTYTPVRWHPSILAHLPCLAEQPAD